MSAAAEQFRYPIGRYQPPPAIVNEQRDAWILEIEALPTALRAELSGLNNGDLDIPYRPGGWTIRQIVHHFADSHLNSYVRFRLALTEQSPVIKPYDEAVWAELPDAKSAPVPLSLSLLDGLHARWVILLRSLDNDSFAQTFRHPELGERRLDWALGLYAWHCRHHLAHIQLAKQSRVRS